MNDDQWEVLWEKHGSLYEFLQSLNRAVVPADRPDFEGDIRSAELEMMRIEAMMNMAANGAPVPLPSDKDLQELRQATGRLQRAVKRGAHAVELVEAAGDVVATWPVT